MRNRVIALKLSEKGGCQESVLQSMATPLRRGPLSLHPDDVRAAGEWPPWKPRIRCRDVNVCYGEKQAIRNVSVDIGSHEVLALIGPPGCGKSSFLRCLNRMNDLIPGCRVTGQILLDDQDISEHGVDVMLLRTRVGMICPKPNAFPRSIFENVAYGARIHGFASSQAELWKIVKKSLRLAGLWEEVKDQLDQKGTRLAEGQQQRLCLARALAVQPEVILMDEPCSGLDPVATSQIEQLIDELHERYAIVVATRSQQQAARISQRTAYFHAGRLIEVGKSAQIFVNPRHRLTNEFITGRFR